MQNSKKIIGLTGNIGSGKSTVAAIFKSYGFPVFDADFAGKIILTHSRDVVKKITSEFGNDLMNSDGEINRKKLAEIVFNSEDKLTKLNSIIHPEVKRIFINWMEAQNHTYIIRESAILFETGIFSESFKNIVVTCPIEERIIRVMQRNNSTREEILLREGKQMDEKIKIERSDVEIKNYDQPLLPQIMKFINQLQSN